MIRFLKACSKMSIDQNDMDVMLEEINKLDKNMIEILERHKIHLLFLKHISQMKCTDKVDIRIRERFSNHLFFLQFKYNEYLDYLNNVVLKVEAQNIEYVVLKGFSFMDEIYKENGIVYRPFADVDLLINDGQINKLNEVLGSENLVQGRIRGEKIIPAERKDILYWRMNSHQLHEYVCFSKYANISKNFRIEFDVNTTIFEGGMIDDPIDKRMVLLHRRKLEIPGKCVINCLDYTYGLIQLCYHFYKDTKYEMTRKLRNDYVLLKFCDIREYIYKYRDMIDWNEFVGIINHAKIGNKIYYSLSLVASFYEDLYIDNVLQQIEVDSHYIQKSIDWEDLLL